MACRVCQVADAPSEEQKIELRPNHQDVGGDSTKGFDHAFQRMRQFYARKDVGVDRNGYEEDRKEPGDERRPPAGHPFQMGLRRAPVSEIGIDGRALY